MPAHIRTALTGVQLAIPIIAGKRDQLEGKIQERYGLQRDAARKQIDDWYQTQTW